MSKTMRRPVGEASQAEQVLSFVERICGADHASLTYGERLQRAQVKAEPIEVDIHRVGADGYVVCRKDGSILHCPCFGDVIRELVSLGL